MYSTLLPCLIKYFYNTYCFPVFFIIYLLIIYHFLPNQNINVTREIFFFLASKSTWMNMMNTALFVPTATHVFHKNYSICFLK